MVLAAASPGMPSFKTAAPTTGYKPQAQTSATDAGWGGGMLAPAGGHNIAAPLSPEAQAQQDALAFYGGLSGPQMAMLQSQYGDLSGQLGTTQAGYDFAKDAANKDAAAQLAKANLGPEYDAITRAAIARQLQGLNATDRNAYLTLGQQYQGFDLQNKQAWQDTARKQWANRSDATGKGAVGSVGYNKRMGNYQQDLANQLQGVGISREETRLGAAQSQADRREQAAKLNDQNKMLDIKAKEYGIDKSQIQANLQEGLAKLGIDNMASINNIMDMMNSNNIQQRALGEQIFREAIGNSSFFMTTPQNTGLPPDPMGGAAGNNPVAGVAVDRFMTRGATR